MMAQPINVVLRNGERATVHAIEQDASIEPWAVRGRRANDVAELWRRDGHWREDGGAHPLDILYLVAPDGSYTPLTTPFQ